MDIIGQPGGNIIDEIVLLPHDFQALDNQNTGNDVVNREYSMGGRDLAALAKGQDNDAESGVRGQSLDDLDLIEMENQQ